MFSFHPINPVNAKKTSHQIFRHMHEVLNKVYLQNFLHRWAVNRECWGLDLQVKPLPSEMLPNSFAGPQREEGKHIRRCRMVTQKRKFKDQDLQRRRIPPSVGRRRRMTAQKHKLKDQDLRYRTISPSSGRR